MRQHVLCFTCAHYRMCLQTRGARSGEEVCAPEQGASGDDGYRRLVTNGDGRNITKTNTVHVFFLNVFHYIPPLGTSQRPICCSPPVKQLDFKSLTQQFYFLKQ